MKIPQSKLQCYESCNRQQQRQQQYQNHRVKECYGFDSSYNILLPKHVHYIKNTLLSKVTKLFLGCNCMLLQCDKLTEGDLAALKKADGEQLKNDHEVSEEQQKEADDIAMQEAQAMAFAMVEAAKFGNNTSLGDILEENENEHEESNDQTKQSNISMTSDVNTPKKELSEIQNLPSSINATPIPDISLNLNKAPTTPSKEDVAREEPFGLPRRDSLKNFGLPKKESFTSFGLPKRDSFGSFGLPKRDSLTRLSTYARGVFDRVRGGNA